jgi:hypothetical protein
VPHEFEKGQVTERGYGDPSPVRVNRWKLERRGGGLSRDDRNLTESRRSLAEDASKAKATAIARRVVVKMSTQGPTTCDGTVARFGAGGLEDVERDEEVERHAKEKGGKRTPGDGSLALDGAGAHAFIRWCGQAR